MRRRCSARRRRSSPSRRGWLRDARRAYAGDEGIQLYERSRLGAVRDYLLRTLDDEGRTRLKLLTPLGVMQRLAIKYTGEAAKRQELLNEDARTVENIETQVAAHTEEMTRAFEQRLQGRRKHRVADARPWRHVLRRDGTADERARADPTRAHAPGVRAAGDRRRAGPARSGGERADRLDGGAGAPALAECERVHRAAAAELGLCAWHAGYWRGRACHRSDRRDLRLQPPLSVATGLHRGEQGRQHLRPFGGGGGTGKHAAGRGGADGSGGSWRGGSGRRASRC